MELQTNAPHSSNGTKQTSSDLGKSLAKKKEDYRKKKQVWRQELSRAKQYLLLTSRNDNLLHDPIYTANTTVPDVVLICVDIEAHEFNQSAVTEIGISTLDTRNIDRTKSAPSAQDLGQLIRSRHLRVFERRNLVNKRHVIGCPDKFTFGQSEWISQNDIVTALTNSFIMAQIRSESTLVLPVLVGQAIEGDIKYMLQSGFDVLPLISDCIDTADLGRATRRDLNARGLGSLLQDHGVEAQHLHNAGNDAYYTLYTLLMIAVASSRTKSTRKDWHQEMARKIEDEKRLAEAKVRLQYEDWSTDDEGDVGDGDTGRAATMEHLKRPKAPQQSNEASAQVPIREHGNRGQSTARGRSQYRGGRGGATGHSSSTQDGRRGGAGRGRGGRGHAWPALA